MRRSCISPFAGIIVACATAATVTTAPGPEHARLLAMTGTWDVEMTLWPQPGRPGTTAKGTSTIRPLFDGLFIEERVDVTLNGIPVSTLAWTGFNTATRQYEATRISSSVPARIAETGATMKRRSSSN